MQYSSDQTKEEVLRKAVFQLAQVFQFLSVLSELIEDQFVVPVSKVSNLPIETASVWPDESLLASQSSLVLILALVPAAQLLHA